MKGDSAIWERLHKRAFVIFVMISAPSRTHIRQPPWNHTLLQYFELRQPLEGPKSTILMSSGSFSEAVIVLPRYAGTILVEAG
jgi:hypothetical protein